MIWQAAVFLSCGWPNLAFCSLVSGVEGSITPAFKKSYPSIQIAQLKKVLNNLQLTMSSSN